MIELDLFDPKVRLSMDHLHWEDTNIVLSIYLKGKVSIIKRLDVFIIVDDSKVLLICLKHKKLNSLQLE